MLVVLMKYLHRQCWPNVKLFRWSGDCIKFNTLSHLWQFCFSNTSCHHVISYREQCEWSELHCVRDVAFTQRSPWVRPRELPWGAAAVSEVTLVQLAQLPAHVSEEETSFKDCAAQEQHPGESRQRGVPEQQEDEHCHPDQALCQEHHRQCLSGQRLFTFSGS